jgi:hypothetical protein
MSGQQDEAKSFIDKRQQVLGMMILLSDVGELL